MLDSEDTGGQKPGEKMLLGEMLVAGGEITREQLEEALETQKRGDARLGVVMIKMGIVDDTTLMRYIAKQTEATIKRLKEM